VKFVMGGLAILMISNVPYPALPKIGIRTLKQIGGTLVLLGAVIGILLYGREFCFPAGMAYVLYGLLKTVVLGLIDRLPSGPDVNEMAGSADQPRRRRGLVIRRGGRGGMAGGGGETGLQGPRQL